MKKSVEINPFSLTKCFEFDFSFKELNWKVKHVFDLPTKEWGYVVFYKHEILEQYIILNDSDNSYWLSDSKKVREIINTHLKKIM